MGAHEVTLVLLGISAGAVCAGIYGLVRAEVHPHGRAMREQMARSAATARYLRESAADFYRGQLRSAVRRSSVTHH